MNLSGCGSGHLIARAGLIMLIGGSVGWTATITDPASRSGVWEATETIDGATAHFLLNIVLLTDDTEQVGTFGLRGITATVTSELGAIGPVGLPDDLLHPICSLQGSEIQMTEHDLSGSCRESSTWWDEMFITLRQKGEGADVLVLGKLRRLSLTFRRIPIDDRSVLDGDRSGTSDLISRHSTLHFRKGALTLDTWGSGQGCWGCMLGGSRLDGDTVTFMTVPSIKHSMFVGKLSPDKQRITGRYSGGAFAGNTFVRMKQ
jgi:hypothetical protein